MSEGQITPAEIEAGNSNLRDPYEGFKSELADLINRHSLENLTDTPDFILAEYVVETLRVLTHHHRACKAWRSPDMQGLSI